MLKASASGADPSTHWDILLYVHPLWSGSISPIASPLSYLSYCLFRSLSCSPHVLTYRHAGIRLECTHMHLSTLERAWCAVP